jgi:hypothetical protein
MKIQKPAGAEVRPCFVCERDLAALSGIAVRTLQSWRFRGIGPPWRRLGSAIRYSLSEFQHWVEFATWRRRATPRHIASSPALTGTKISGAAYAGNQSGRSIPW